MEKAKALMTQSGAGAINTTISFDLGDAVNCEPIAELIQESLGHIGITTTINKVPGSNWRSEMAKKAMPLMVNFFSGWLDYPEYFFFWCYSGQNAIFNTPSYVNKDMDTLIDGARAAAAVADWPKYDTDVKGFISQGLSRCAARAAVPALSERRDAKQHFGLLLLVPSPGRLPLAGQSLMRAGFNPATVPPCWPTSFAGS